MSLDSRPRVRSIRRQRSNLVSALVLAMLVGAALVGGTLTGAQAAPAEFKYKTYKIPSAGSEARYITVGSDGNLWFTEGRAFFTPNPDPDTGGTFHSNIGRITPAGNITEFRFECGGCTPDDIVSGPDGALYFTTNDFGSLVASPPRRDQLRLPRGRGRQPGQLHPRRRHREPRQRPVGCEFLPQRPLWRYNVVTGAFTEFPAVGLDPGDVSVDGDGIVWFTAPSAVGRLDPSTGNITTTEVPDTSLNSIAVASDGKVWFTDRFNDTVGYLDPDSGNQVSQFDRPAPARRTSPPRRTEACGSPRPTSGTPHGSPPTGLSPKRARPLATTPTADSRTPLGLPFSPPRSTRGPERESVWFVMSAANKIASLK